MIIHNFKNALAILIFSDSTFAHIFLMGQLWHLLYLFAVFLSVSLLNVQDSAPQANLASLVSHHGLDVNSFMMDFPMYTFNVHLAFWIDH